MAIQVSYYPGCSLHGTAAEYDASLQAVCRALGIELRELEDWNCCGASSAHFVNDQLALGLAERNLRIAERAGLELLVPCAACFQRLKYAQKHGEAAHAVSAGIAVGGTAHSSGEEGEGTGGQKSAQISVWHVNEFFDRPPLLGEIRARVRRQLTGLKAVAYYGCLSQRPPKVTDAPAAEDPQCMDRLLALLGVEVRPWSYKTDCCGGSLVLTRTDVAKRLIDRLVGAAREAGAECIVTDCPLCQSNLDSRQADESGEGKGAARLPVFYISELMALAFDLPDLNRLWRRHLIDPRPLLTQKGFVPRPN